MTESFVREALHEWETPAVLPPETDAPAAPMAGRVPLPAEDRPPCRSANPALPTLEENERAHILEALRLTGGRLSGPRGAAALLGVPRSTLQHRLRKLGITV